MKQSLLKLMEVQYVDHLAVTTPNFEQTLHDYLGLDGSRLLKGPALNPAQKVQYAFVLLREGMTVEILGISDNTPIAQHVKQGGGPYHFCYAVNSIEEAISRAEQVGAKLIVKPIEDVAFDGRRIAFLYQEAQGVFELVETQPSQNVNIHTTNNNKVGIGSSSQSKLLQKPAINSAAIEERVKKVFGNVFPNIVEGVVETAAINITQGWDSLKHIRLIMELEAEFDINILPEDIGMLTNYSSILEKLKKGNL